MQAQLAAAQAEAEQRLAVGAREIEALRDELERVRVEMQEARMAATAVVRPVEPVALAPQELAVAIPVEPAPVAFVAEPEPIAFVAEPAAQPMATAEPEWEPRR